MKILILILMLLIFTSANAEVVDKAAGGFTIEIVAESPGSAELAYAQFIRIGEWWDGNHSWFGSAENFSLDPRAGGCFCEIDGDGQVQHMTVSFVDPGSEVRLLGGLGPLQMMAVNGAMSWTFKDLENGNTEIKHRYTVTGYAKGGLDKLAPIVDSVQAGQVQRLIGRLNESKIEE